jgi:hypothetical protein
VLWSDATFSMDAFSAAPVLLQRTALAATLGSTALKIKARTGVRRPSLDSAAFAAAGVPADGSFGAALGPVMEVPPAKAVKRAGALQDSTASNSPADRTPLHQRDQRKCGAAAASRLTVQPLVPSQMPDVPLPSSLRAAPLPLAVAAAVAPSRRVSFARGSLEGTADGHPEHEGELARPVRHLPQPYANDLTKGNVLMLEQLLREECSDCSASIARLKRRVGLMPLVRLPRPHAVSCSAAAHATDAGCPTPVL